MSCALIRTDVVLWLQATVGDGLDVVAQLAHRLSTSSADDAQQAAEPAAHDSQSMTQGSASLDSWHSQHLDLLVVDAGSGDASVPMSCPPAPFLESRFLEHARQLLKPGGMLAVNCVSRAAEPYTAAVKALQVGAVALCPIQNSSSSSLPDLLSMLAEALNSVLQLPMLPPGKGVATRFLYLLVRQMC